jgi:hypothetical protein
MLHTKDMRHPFCNLAVDGVYPLASAPSLAEEIQEFGLQGFGPIFTETHCQKVDRGLGNPYAKFQIYWERSSPPEHEISYGQCSLLKMKCAPLVEEMNAMISTLKQCCKKALW